MAEAIASEDEIKRIATEFVRQNENIGDVTVTNLELRSENEPYIWVIQGNAKRHVMKQNVDYILSECSFTMLISNRDKKIRNYKPSEWFYHYSIHDLQEEDQPHYITSEIPNINLNNVPNPMKGIKKQTREFRKNFRTRN